MDYKFVHPRLLATLNSFGFSKNDFMNICIYRHTHTHRWKRNKNIILLLTNSVFTIAFSPLIYLTHGYIIALSIMPHTCVGRYMKCRRDKIKIN